MDSIRLELSKCYSEKSELEYKLMQVNRKIGDLKRSCKHDSEDVVERQGRKYCLECGEYLDD